MGKNHHKVKVKPGPLMYPLPVIMVTAGDGAAPDDEKNVLTAAWTGIVNTHPPMLSVSIRKSRHTHDMIQSRGEFVVNLVNEELTRATDFCGVRSGRDLDKFAEMDLHTMPATEVSAPMIVESPVNLECKVTEIHELPSHDMFIAEIVAVNIDEDCIDEDGAYNYADMDLVAFNHGGYYKVGRKELGRFGYSVMRPSTLKKKRREEAEKRAAKAATRKKTASVDQANSGNAEEKGGSKGKATGKPNSKSKSGKESKKDYRHKRDKIRKAKKREAYKKKRQEERQKEFKQNKPETSKKRFKSFKNDDNDK